MPGLIIGELDHMTEFDSATEIRGGAYVSAAARGSSYGSLSYIEQENITGGRYREGQEDVTTRKWFRIGWL